MSALHIPEDGCCCTDDLYSVVQACVDQIVGFATFVTSGIIEPDATQVLGHTAQVGAVIQAALTAYAENHGTPDAYHAALAAAHITTALRP